MPIDAKLPQGLSRSFFLPVAEALGSGESRRKCPVIDDLGWLMAGTTRALAAVVSGRHFLQTIVEEVASAWERTTYFEALKSKRRLGLLREINEFVCRVTMRAVLPDRLAGVPGIDNYDVYAGDGHWHEHATHEQCLRHLDVAECCLKSYAACPAVRPLGQRRSHANCRLRSKA
jgi:hypothetical protein